MSQRRGKEDGRVVKSVKNKDKGLLYDYELEEQQAMHFFSPFFCPNEFTKNMYC